MVESDQRVLLIPFSWKDFVKQVTCTIPLIYVHVCEFAKLAVGQQSFIVQSNCYILCVKKLPSATHLIQGFTQDVIRYPPSCQQWDTYIDILQKLLWSHF